MSVVLIVDDEENLRDQYCEDLTRLGGYEMRAVEGVDAALEILEREPIDCILLDLRMPGKDGFALLDLLRREAIGIPTIVYTADASYESCVKAIKKGAHDFFSKEIPMELVVHAVERALEATRLTRELFALKGKTGEDEAVLGRSPAFRRMLDEIDRFAEGPATVLLCGESGCGKTLAARELHRRSGRTGPFVDQTLGGLPEGMIPAAVRGHYRGSYTGAIDDRPGCFEQARGGTLLLDDIHCMPTKAQATLLDVLDKRSIQRIGGTKEIPLDVRIIVATNRDLAEMVDKGRFLPDLLFRLKGLRIDIPPLRDRREDIPLLAARFVERVCREHGKPPKRISESAMRRLIDLPWQGNVRELEMAVQAMVYATDEEILEEHHIPAELRAGGIEPPTLDVESGPSFEEQKNRAERRIILAALERAGGSVPRAAAELELSDRGTLRKMMIRLGLRESHPKR